MTGRSEHKVDALFGNGGAKVVKSQRYDFKAARGEARGEEFGMWHPLLQGPFGAAKREYANAQWRLVNRLRSHSRKIGISRRSGAIVNSPLSFELNPSQKPEGVACLPC